MGRPTGGPRIGRRPAAARRRVPRAGYAGGDHRVPPDRAGATGPADGADVMTRLVAAVIMATALAVAACGPSEAELEAKLCRISRLEAAAADSRASVRTGGSGEPMSFAEGLSRSMAGERPRDLAAAKADAAKARAELETYTKISAEERAVATANLARQMGGMSASAIEASYARSGCLRP
jgi:hypothetical protein